jgi:hypothetical protein
MDATFIYRSDRVSAIAPAPTPSSINGRQLAYRLQKLNSAKRALLARDLECGAVHLQNLTRPQAATLTRVSVSYVNTVQRASLEERKRLACGLLTLSALHNKHRRQPVSDADVERIVIKIGADRVMSALDRITAPVLVAAQ